jgi:hypothetical protein
MNSKSDLSQASDSQAHSKFSPGHGEVLVTADLNTGIDGIAWPSLVCSFEDAPVSIISTVKGHFNEGQE